jgi:HTH-type transcriptional regulator/antitoxin HigA
MAHAIRLIKTPEDCEAALAHAEALMDAEPGTADGDELELWATLIELYEDKAFPIGLPSAAEAIKFRMEQMGLRPRDLVPYIGSMARVSELLAGKRPLTLKMARALHRKFGIPAKVLLQDEGATLPESEPDLDWTRFPMSAIAKAGWFAPLKASVRDVKDCAEELMRGLFERATPGGLQPALLRSGVRSGAEMDAYALMAWQARVLGIARQRPVAAPYHPGTIHEDFIRETLRLSYLDEGPGLVRDFLSKNGVHFVVLNHLPRTHLDGAAMNTATGNPVVALTLRHDRLDNFWFCLAHELAHVALHLGQDGDAPFFDDLDFRGDGLEQAEREADQLAGRALIDDDSWSASDIEATGDPKAVRRLASVLRINPAIVAGRYRYATNNYRALTQFVGQGAVRRHFPEAMRGE